MEKPSVMLRRNCVSRLLYNCFRAWVRSLCHKKASTRPHGSVPAGLGCAKRLPAIEPWNPYGWKRPLRSSCPAISPSPWCQGPASCTPPMSLCPSAVLWLPSGEAARPWGGPVLPAELPTISLIRHEPVLPFLIHFPSQQHPTQAGP